MKKILLFSFLAIIIPIFVTNIIFKKNTNQLIYEENMQIRIKRKSGNIDVMPLEVYLVGVLAGEMPLTFTDEALKAQAIASRTYALKKMENNINNTYDVVDTVQNQVYLDEKYLKSAWKTEYEKNIDRLKKIVSETRGIYLTYNGKTIESFYFSTSSGLTENSEDIFGISLPYLQNVKSSWDNISPVYIESKKFTMKDFCDLLKIINDGYLKIEIIKRTNAGSVKTILINEKEYLGAKLVSNLNLKSANFDIAISNGEVLVTTKGYGHGVGMSQYGAQAMSLLGYNYQEILKYYYKDVEFKKI